MTNICKNCNHITIGNYCSNCGQSTSVNNIDFRFILHDLQHGFLHFDNGLLFTIKELFIRPGQSIRNFINGKWMKYFHPLSLLLILTALYSLFSINKKFESSSDEFLNTFYDVFHYLSNHRNILVILLLPIFSLISKLVFREKKYNYFEFLVLEAYTQSVLIFVSILLLPVTNYYSNNQIITYFTFFVLHFFSIRIKVLFFNENKKLKIIFYSILTSTLNYLVLIFLFLLITTAVYFYKSK